MGLDPSALHKIPTPGGRGGRGGMRGRGAMRGRGGGRSLDNRPTALLITNTPEDLYSDSSLREHFQVSFSSFFKIFLLICLLLYAY